jgi:hypothetical protein
MKKALLLLVAGVVVGYQVGWKDAQDNTETIVERVIGKVRGSDPDRYRNDIDAQFERLEGRH